MDWFEPGGFVRERPTGGAAGVLISAMQLVGTLLVGTLLVGALLLTMLIFGALILGT